MLWTLRASQDCLSTDDMPCPAPEEIPMKIYNSACLLYTSGKPLITWTLEAFDAAERVSRIVVVCPPDRSDEMRRCV